MKEVPLVVTFHNSLYLSGHVGLNLLNLIESATIHCSFKLQEQEKSQGAGSGEYGRCGRTGISASSKLFVVTGLCACLKLTTSGMVHKLGNGCHMH